MLNATDLQAEITATIANVLANDGEGVGHYIRIARFIGELDATRDDVVKAFVALQKDQVIDLAPESNTKVLTLADKRHALRIGSEDLHLVALQP
jgi:hypothetical protein